MSTSIRNNNGRQNLLHVQHDQYSLSAVASLLASGLSLLRPSSTSSSRGDMSTAAAEESASTESQTMGDVLDKSEDQCQNSRIKKAYFSSQPFWHFTAENQADSEQDSFVDHNICNIQTSTIGTPLRTKRDNSDWQWQTDDIKVWKDHHVLNTLLSQFNQQPRTGFGTFHSETSTSFQKDHYTTPKTPPLGHIGLWKSLHETTSEQHRPPGLQNCRNIPTGFGKRSCDFNSKFQSGFVSKPQSKDICQTTGNSFNGPRKTSDQALNQLGYCDSESISNLCQNDFSCDPNIHANLQLGIAPPVLTLLLHANHAIKLLDTISALKQLICCAITVRIIVYTAFLKQCDELVKNLRIQSGKAEKANKVNNQLQIAEASRNMEGNMIAQFGQGGEMWEMGEAAFGFGGEEEGMEMELPEVPDFGDEQDDDDSDDEFEARMNQGSYGSYDESALLYEQESISRVPSFNDAADYHQADPLLDEWANGVLFEGEIQAIHAGDNLVMPPINALPPPHPFLVLDNNEIVVEEILLGPANAG